VTAFVIVCAVMLAAALVWLTLPLLRPKAPVDAASTRTERRTASIVVAISLSAVAVAMYVGLSNWNWKAVETETAKNASVEDMLKSLEAKLAANPKDVDGWLLLGRSYTALSRFGRAADAYQQAYDLTRGENVDAIIGLGEALALTDEASLSGRAGQLFDAALQKAPNHPKALWYGSMAALQANNLKLGRDRLQLMLAQNPPEQIRGVIERQVQDLNAQLGEGPAAATTPPGMQPPAPNAATAAPSGQSRSIKVAVKIAPDIQKQLSGALPLFVLARDPQAGGPPLAVQRHSSAEAPLNLELSERDAMIATRTIASVPRVKVVARLSKTGAPQAQSGDFYGEADYEFAKDTGTLQITIDRSVP
jgi:cytochrome c-type biogenesis protein CcmH